jgi:ABC-2 type transport system permease protein
MTTLKRSVKAEWMKAKRSDIMWVTFIAFAIGPLMGGLIFYLLRHVENGMIGGMLMEKAKMMSLEVNWSSYFALLAQVMGVGGVLVFGFAISWIFGREYADKTAKDLLALPTSRSTILNAKFILYLIWCLTLALSNLVLGLIAGKIAGIGVLEISIDSVQVYFTTTLLVILLGMPISFFALWGRGYLAPLGFVALTLVVSQIIAALGLGHYFPWALPGLYSGSAGEYKALIDLWSYLILVAVSVLGFVCTHWWWNRTDQH